ncbi:MAG: hypothetical protein EOO36_18345, partial [Cytophagaceae bacterium]
MKVFFRRIHLYLGLASGLFLVVVCLTGTILVFEEELTHAFHRERYVVEAASTPRLSLTQLAAAVRATKPKAKINGLKVYADPTRSVEVSLAGGGRPGGPPGEGPGPRGQRGEGQGEHRNRGGEGTSEPRGERLGEQRGESRTQAGGPMNDAGSPGAKGKGGRGGDRGPTLFLNPYTGAVLGEFK